MLRVVNEILQEDYGTDISHCSSALADMFIYLDDGMYTGNRLRYDLTGGEGAAAWIPRHAPAGSTLIVYVLVMHLQGYLYAVNRYLAPAAEAKGITLQPPWWGICVDNRHEYGSKAECLWPEELTGDDDVDWYKRQFLQRSDVFRPSSIPIQEVLFTSPDARRKVEWAFLKAGARLIRANRTHADSIRPLGFEKLESLGFGTPCIMYRNIANNCPLALWWGLNSWYPLFRRRTNDQSDGMIGDADSVPSSDVIFEDTPF